MPLEILDRVGQSVSGAPIFRVRCTLCGIEYQVTAGSWQIIRKGGCATCMHPARKMAPGTKVTPQVSKRRSRINTVLRQSGFRIRHFDNARR